MSILPSVEHGFLPYFLLYAGSAAIIHSIVSYLWPISSLKAFSGRSAPPKHALTAHVYAVKNLYTSLIRLFAAYSIHNGPLYDLTIVTFLGVLFLYGGEVFVWRTVGAREAVSPFITASLGLFWMLIERNWYIAIA